MAKKYKAISSDNKNEIERDLKTDVESEIEAYLRRPVLSVGFDFRNINQNGSWRIEIPNWTGCSYAPIDLNGFGHLRAWTNGLDIKLDYTDDAGNYAEWAKINGAWVIPAENPGGWIYPPSQPLTEYDENGKQMITVGTVKDGKFTQVQQRGIRIGVEVLGLLPEPNVISGVPVLPQGQIIQSLNGDYIYHIPEWNNIVNGPSNLHGTGFLKISYHNGRVHFQAYSYETNDFAYALISSQGGLLSEWQIDTDSFYSKSSIDYLLALYSKLGHDHDERYFIKYQILQLLEQYMPVGWRPTTSDVLGLDIALSTKIDFNVFQNAQPSDAVVLGPNGVPVAADLSNAYTPIVALKGAKQGTAYTTTIENISLFFPRGSANQRISAVSSERWVNFGGAIVGGSGSNIIISGTPTNEKTVMLSFDFIYTIAGYERRTQRVLFISVEPSGSTPTAPLAITWVGAVSTSPTEVYLEWIDNADNETAIEIHRSLDNITFVKIDSLGPNVTNYTNTGLTSPNTYYYKVIPVNSAGSNAAISEDVTMLSVDPPAVAGGLFARYFDSVNLTDLVESRVDAEIYFDLTNDAPSNDVTVGAWSVRWSGYIKVPVSGNYQFSFSANSQVRIVFGGILVVDRWTNDQPLTFSFTKEMIADTNVPIIIEMVENENDTVALLSYLTGNTSLKVPSDWLVPDEFLGADIATPVLSGQSIDTQTIKLTWTFAGANPDKFEVFGGTQNDPILPLLGNYQTLGSLREMLGSGLPSGTTFYFEVRAVKGGLVSKNSNRVQVSTQSGPGGGEDPNPLNASPVGISRTNDTTTVVTFTDNNTGTESETYGFRYRNVNDNSVPTVWNYLTSTGTLSTNPANIDYRPFPASTIKAITVSNSFFLGAKVRVEVIVKGSTGLFSEWVGATETDPLPEQQAPDILPVAKFTVRRNPNGSYYDADSETEGSFHAFYMLEDDLETSELYNADGTPKKFENVFLPSYSLIQARKLMVRKSLFPNRQELIRVAYLANLDDNYPERRDNIAYNALTTIRTFQEPDDDTGPVENATRATVVKYDATYPVYIIIGIMGWAEFKMDFVKRCAAAAKQAGFKGVQISFSPFRVWKNYSSPGAFDANNLEFDWLEINEIVEYVCNELKISLFVRLWNDMSDFSLAYMARNVANTNGLKEAWISYLDVSPSGSVIGLKMQNPTTPPWLLMLRFMSAFKQQYATYWNTGKIVAWEWATNTNQEAQPNPNFPGGSLTEPTFVDYITRTEQMRQCGQVVLAAMSGWDDHFWNCGSFYNWGGQLAGNSMGYMRYADGFKGIRGNHASEWPASDYDFYDSLGYTRSCQNPESVSSTPVLSQKYFATEYFRASNLVEADAMANACKQSMENGAWVVGFIFDDGNTDSVTNYILSVGDKLREKGALTLPRATGMSFKGITQRSIKQAFDSNSAMLPNWYTDKGNSTLRQKALILYSPSSTNGLINIDFLFVQGDPITNQINFFLKLEDSEMSQNNQICTPGTASNRYIPNGSSIPAAFYIAPQGKSTVSGSIAGAFWRFGVDFGNLIAAYPAKDIFTIAVYANKNSSLNNPAGGGFNNFTVRLTKFGSCHFEVTALANGVDFKRPDSCISVGPTDDFIDSVTSTSAVKVGEITYIKSANLVYYKNL